MIDERPPEVCLRCGTQLSRYEPTMACVFTDNEGQMEAWVNDGILHVTDRYADGRQVEDLLDSVSDQGVTAVLCRHTGGSV